MNILETVAAQKTEIEQLKAQLANQKPATKAEINTMKNKAMDGIENLNSNDLNDLIAHADKCIKNTVPAPVAANPRDNAHLVEANATLERLNQRALRDIGNINRTDLIAGKWGQPDSLYVNGSEVWIFSKDKKGIVHQSCVEFKELKERGTDFYANKISFSHWSPIIIEQLKKLEQKLNGLG